MDKNTGGIRNRRDKKEFNIVKPLVAECMVNKGIEEIYEFPKT